MPDWLNLRELSRGSAMKSGKSSRIEKLIGRRVAVYRRLAAITQEELAERVQTAPETISRLERGETIPSFATLAGISRALNLDLHEFFAIPGQRSAKDDALDALVRDLRHRSKDEIVLVHDVARRILAPRKRDAKNR